LQAAIMAALPESPEKSRSYEVPACAGMTALAKFYRYLINYKIKFIEKHLKYLCHGTFW